MVTNQMNMVNMNKVKLELQRHGLMTPKIMEVLDGIPVMNVVITSQSNTEVRKKDANRENNPS